MADESVSLHRKLLSEAVATLLRDYSFEELMTEVAEQRPAFDIYVTATGYKPKCPLCGHEHPGG